MLDDATLVRLDLEQDAARLTGAVHIETLAQNNRVVVLEIVEQDGTWIRTLIGDDDNACWHRAA